VRSSVLAPGEAGGPAAAWFAGSAPPPGGCARAGLRGMGAGRERAGCRAGWRPRFQGCRSGVPTGCPQRTGRWIGRRRPAVCSRTGGRRLVPRLGAVGCAGLQGLGGSAITSGVTAWMTPPAGAGVRAAAGAGAGSGWGGGGAFRAAAVRRSGLAWPIAGSVRWVRRRGIRRGAAADPGS